MHRCIQTIVLILLISQSTLFAHEFWIEPESFQYQPKDLIKLRTFVGERFEGDSLPRDERLIERFAAHGTKGETRILGRSGSPLSLTRITEPGTYVLSYRSKRVSNEMKAKQFEEYLRHEGLGFVIPMRKEKGESDSPGREIFSRCAKSLIRVGKVTDREYEKAVGLPLEILLESDPADVTEDRPFVARVMFNGKPLIGAQVVAVAKSSPDLLNKATTDESGRVTFPIDKAGVWMITTIHMVRAPKDLDADWESFWASFTFETAPADPKPPKPTNSTPSDSGRQHVPTRRSAGGDDSPQSGDR